MDTSFHSELEHLLNRHSIDNQLNMPDYILAELIMNILEDLTQAQHKTRRWHMQ